MKNVVLVCPSTPSCLPSEPTPVRLRCLVVENAARGEGKTEFENDEECVLFNGPSLACGSYV